MKILGILLKYAFINQIRNRWLILYAIFYFCTSYGLIQFGGDTRKAVASLISVVILFNPAIAILYSAVYWYSLSNFNQLLLIQPIKRSQVLFSNWIAISGGLSASFVLGTGGAFILLSSFGGDISYLLFVGTLLNVVFCALGILCSIYFVDRMRGIAAAMGMWLYFSLVHDSLIFVFLTLLRGYPIEKSAFVLSGLSPIDIARLLLLVEFDFAALMGYTGALLKRMADSGVGALVMILGLAVWVVVPYWVARRVFDHRDL